MPTYLSKNFTLEEMTKSETARQRGIRNDLVTAEQVANLTALCHQVLQPLRDWIGSPILIGSGYRCPALNRAVGGVENSQHMKGEAVDIFIKGDTVFGQMLFNHIEQSCHFDKLIWEHNEKGTFWIHVSYKANGQNRHIVIRDMLKK